MEKKWLTIALAIALVAALAVGGAVIVLLTLLAAVAVTALGISVTPTLLRLMDTPEDVLDGAIAEGKQVRITYGYYGTDMKLHKAKNPDGTEKRQTLNPYQMVASEGRYYLICNNDHHDNAANYRIDRMMNIELLDTPVKPKSQVTGLENGLNLQDYVYQNLNMFSGKAEKVEFVIPKNAVSIVIDFFGKHVSFHEQEDGMVSCRLTVSREAMRRWAVQFGNVARVVSPPELVEEIREEIRKAAALYDA